MPRDYKVYLEDILYAAEKIRSFISGLSFETFRQDAKTLDAVIRNLEVIGEATKKIPEQIRLKNPEVDWKRIAGLRDILIHEYFGVDVEIIWDIVQHKVDVLEKLAQRILRE